MDLNLLLDEKGNAKGQEIQDFYDYMMAHNFKRQKEQLPNMILRKNILIYLKDVFHLERSV